MLRQIAITSLLTIVTACGLSDPKVVLTDATGGSNTGGAGTGAGTGTGGGSATGSGSATGGGADAGLTAFSASFGATVKTSCSCHGSEKISGKTLGKDDSANRDTLLAYMVEEFSGCDAAKLKGKIQGTTANHGGASSAKSADLSGIATWVDAEAKCP